MRTYLKTEQTFDLSGHDLDGDSGCEGGDHRSRDEVD